uniref:D-aminoacyl-tRNA deacylase n=1 Tax=Amphilophus citrinellus TaxID=61819 RepID=A0A3Q0T103_AMPCI
PGSAPGLQARTVIQQCSHAKVKIKPALDGTDAQWAELCRVKFEICFRLCLFSTVFSTANKLMTTRLFRKNAGHSVSLLDLPGSILFVPQDSLLGKTAPNRRMQYIGGCELWWGAQLFSNLVSVCRELMSGSAKCTSAGVKVEHGLYGQKQEISLTSVEPLTVLLEF